DWTKDGQFPHKMNSVNDVVDIAEWLVKNKYSSPSKIVLMGGSAGTFLVGNAMNQRPELFAAGIYLAGLPDLATHTDAAGAREGNKTTGPKNTPEGFLSNYQQSALYHIPEGRNLPGILIIHGATDYILSMSPAARYAARLQEHQKGDRPILFLVDWEGGHATINENEPFYILKFALWQTGHPEFQLNK
ncbi:MAG TPA: prolyl oligopeptidase family serine peptidase, partial [Chitinophagaceae bacterium]|nr:prolyl oligopeptidase family serine peptidase [Chitinophagaceae bacterium]